MKVSYNDNELVVKVREWVRSLSMSGGKDWALQVPVNFDKDPDVLIEELCKRFESSYPPIIEQGREVSQWVKGNDRLPELTWKGVVRWTDSASFAVMSEFGFCDGNIYDFGKVFESQPIEWLEKITIHLGYSLEDMYNLAAHVTNFVAANIGNFDVTHSTTPKDVADEFINSLNK